MNVGEVRTFNYTGGIQQITLTDKGLYKLDAYGAQGGNARQESTDPWNTGGNGGHSTGYIVVGDTPITLYICVGGHPNNATGAWTGSAGYNGGGSYDSAGNNATNGGGGATHIATVSGLLKDIGYTQFVTNRKGLIVAGGGGGATRYYAATASTGGGLTGGNTDTSVGGTQTSGYAFGLGESGHDGMSSGSGGGLYGGLISRGGGLGKVGAGGSGYIGGTPTVTFKGQTYAPSTENGAQTGNGKATVQLVAKEGANVRIGNTVIDDIRLGNAEITGVYLGSVPIE